MNFNFFINKYLLIWNILYEKSLSEDIHKLKQKLWNNYRKEYTVTHKEKAKILKERDDYIPDDDYLFNVIEKSESYKKIKQETNRYRLTLLEIWTTNNKKFIRNLNKIVKYDIKQEYDVFLIHPEFDMMDINFESKTMLLGKKITIKEKDSFMIFLFFKLLQNEFGKIKESEKEIYSVILELVCLNELYSKISGVSKYHVGDKKLVSIKNKIYPYWLMYLGIEKENMEKHMIKDNLFFDINDYTYIEKLKKYDIFSFIDFIINNKKAILSKKLIGIDKIKIESL